MRFMMRKSDDSVVADGPLQQAGLSVGATHDGIAIQDEAAGRMQRVVQLQDEARWQYQLAEHTIEQIWHCVEHGAASPYDADLQVSPKPDDAVLAPRPTRARQTSKRQTLMLATLAIAALGITTGLVVSLQAATTDAPASSNAILANAQATGTVAVQLGNSPMTTVATVNGSDMSVATHSIAAPPVDRDIGLAIYAARYAKAPASERNCLARAVYYEARGEAIDGQIAVAQVIMNRARSKKWPGTICGVVNQGVERGEKCQFSFACFQHLSEPTGEMWDQARLLSEQALAGQAWLRELVDATHYHATGVAPVWRLGLTEIATIGTHVFYREGEGVRPSVATPQAYQASAAVQAVRAKIAAVVKAARPKLAAAETAPAERPKLAVIPPVPAAPKKASASAGGGDWKTSVFQQ